MLFRKMLKNRWLVLSLLVGMTLCTAMTASMPIYTDAILKRMLIKEMDRSYTASSLHPARLYTVLNAAPLDPRVQGKAVKELDAFWESVPMNTEELEPLVYFKERTSWTFQIEPVDPHRVDPNVMRRVYLTMRSGLFDRVRLIDGRFPSPEPVDGVYEALVTDNTLVQLRTVLDHEFVVSDGQRHVSRPFRIKPVGVIAESDLQDLYWNHSSLRNYDNHFFIDESLFERDILGEEPIIRLARATWYTTYEYNDFDLDKAVTALQVFERTRDRFRHSFANYADVSFPLEETLEGYKEREAALKRFLGSLNVPLYILIAFYLYVISNLIVERQKPGNRCIAQPRRRTVANCVHFCMRNADFSADRFRHRPVDRTDLLQMDRLHRYVHGIRTADRPSGQSEQGKLCLRRCGGMCRISAQSHTGPAGDTGQHRGSKTDGGKTGQKIILALFGT